MQVTLDYETEAGFAPYIDDPQPYLGTPCIPMATALAHIYSEEGLVIGADGFNFIRTSARLERVSERAQKIFPMSGTERHVVCSFYGRVTFWNEADEKVFNFASACRDAAASIASVPARDANEFAGLICPLVLESLASVKRSGRLNRYPSPQPPQPGELGRTLVRVFVDGYFSEQPYRTGIRFYHVDQKLGWDHRLHELSSWNKSLFYGSSRVADLLFKTSDPRLEKHRTNACRLVATRLSHPDTPVPLCDAVEAARNFIAACSDRVAQEIDGEDYQRIGGEPQIATITPKEGFHWVDRPETFDPL
jgi:hypothetical protein